MLALSLPFALVPYNLIAPLLDTTPTATPTISSGVFGQLPVDDGWVNVARIFQCILGLGTSNMWMLRGRDSILGGLGVERGDRLRVGRWVGLTIWVLVVSLACLGGWVAEKVETLGVIATLAVAWLLPCEYSKRRCLATMTYGQPCSLSLRFMCVHRCRLYSHPTILLRNLPQTSLRAHLRAPIPDTTAYPIHPPMFCWLARRDSFKSGDWAGGCGRTSSFMSGSSQ